MNKKVVQDEVALENEKAKGSKKNGQAEKIVELTNDLQRTRADFENYRKQVEMQRMQAVEAARYATVMKVLPLLDNLDLAIRAHEELQPLLKTLEKTLKELELEKINAEVGMEFNPDVHEAVMMEEGEGEKEVIAEELRPGYLYEGKVLRPTMVKVRKA